MLKTDLESLVGITEFHGQHKRRGGRGCGRVPQVPRYQGRIQLDPGFLAYQQAGQQTADGQTAPRQI